MAQKINQSSSKASALPEAIAQSAKQLLSTESARLQAGASAAALRKLPSSVKEVAEKDVVVSDQDMVAGEQVQDVILAQAAPAAASAIPAAPAAATAAGLSTGAMVAIGAGLAAVAAAGGSDSKPAPAPTPPAPTPPAPTPPAPTPPAPPTGQSFSLTEGVNIVNGTTGADTITGASGTLGSSDLIIDEKSGDGDTLNVTYGSADNTAAATATIRGIENVNITANYLGDVAFDATNVKGATITMARTSANFNVGTAKVTSAGANSVAAGANVSKLEVTGLTSGSVDAGTATTVTLDATDAASMGYVLTVNGNTKANLNYTNASSTATDRVLSLSATKDATVTLGTITGTSVTQVVGGGIGAISITAATAAVTGATITGVSKVTLSEAAADTVVIDVGSFNAAVGLTSAALDTTVNKISGQAITLASLGQTVNYSAKTASSSTVNFNVTKDDAVLQLAASGSEFGTMNVTLGAAVTAVDEIGLSGTTTLTAASDVVIARVEADARETLAINGTGDVEIALYTQGTGDIKINASALVGGLTVDTADENATVSGGTGDDDITLGATTQKVSVSTGTGDDTVTFDATVDDASITVSTGEGDDTIDFVDLDVLTDAKIAVDAGDGNDKISLGTAYGIITNDDTQVTIDGGEGTDTVELFDLTDIGYGTEFTSGSFVLRNVEALKINSNVTIESSILSGQTLALSGAAATAANNILTVGVLSSTTTVNLAGITAANTVKKVNIDVGNASDISGVTVYGTTGADSIDGGLGDDTIYGGQGDDTIYSGQGADVISGGDGDDEIDVEGDNVTVTGGKGVDDIYLYSNSTEDTVVFAAGDSDVLDHDSVYDFELDTDILDLSSAVVAADVFQGNGTNFGDVKSHSIINGFITFDDDDTYGGNANLAASDFADVVKYLQANITVAGAVVVFEDGFDSWLFQNNAAGDLLIRFDTNLVEAVGSGTVSGKNTLLIA